MAESGHDDGDDRRRPLMLVTGCSEGSIGHAVVHAFVAARCSVIATARSYASMRGFRGCLLLLVLLSLLLRCRQCNMCVISCEF
jgi:NAD(P)-dependent dehydrogenase (short-subunit alcohol dehydrogenase family)